MPTVKKKPKKYKRTRKRNINELRWNAQKINSHYLYHFLIINKREKIDEICHRFYNSVASLNNVQGIYDRIPERRESFAIISLNSNTNPSDVDWKKIYSGKRTSDPNLIDTIEEGPLGYTQSYLRKILSQNRE
jgi:hypothetical protein